MIISNEDTIAAISTPPGEGGIAVVRISGKKSRIIADKIFCGQVLPSAAHSHTVHYGTIHYPDSDSFLDEVLLSVMWGPNSYTSEDVIEVSSHGGPLIATKILELCLKYGARLATPGEFTQRAFLNGKIDLIQAEAVADMISAKTELSLKAAAEQLGGALSNKIKFLGEKLRNLLALLEAYTDFPEEEMNVSDNKKLVNDLFEIKAKILRLVDSYAEGKIIRNGLKVPIVGKPNVGKSSLFNRLLEENRAIVTEIPGTTRDTVSEYINIKGIPVELIDTAGIRQSGDLIEAEGIRRAQAEIEKADIIIALVDMTDSNIIDDIKSLKLALSGTNYLMLANKADLAENDIIEARKIALAEFNPIPISASTGMGLDRLKANIYEKTGRLLNSSTKSEMVITNVRHRDALNQSLEFLSKVEEGMELGNSYEFQAFDLKNAISCLEEIIGKTTPDQILDKIFSQFCIGK